MKNRLILIITIAVVLLFIVVTAISLTSNPESNDSRIFFISNEEVEVSDGIKIKLMDSEGKGIANSPVHFKFTPSGGQNIEFTLNSDKNGHIDVDTSNISLGNYVVNASFAGDDHYDATSSVQNVLIKAYVEDVPVVIAEPNTEDSSDDSSSGEDTSYEETSADYSESDTSDDSSSEE